MKNLLTFLAGLGFGIGLIISGMTNPAKVIGFLDLFGVWDPSLMFVMIGAIFVTFFGFKFIEKRKMTFFEEALHLSGKTHINKDLVVGSILFGAGWAMAGLCPGPALVALGSGNQKAIIFVVAMLAGMYIHDHPYKKAFSKSSNSPTKCWHCVQATWDLPLPKPLIWRSGSRLKTNTEKFRPFQIQVHFKQEECKQGIKKQVKHQQHLFTH